MLPHPTLDLVQNNCGAFDSEPFTKLSEDALEQLLLLFPNNTDPAQILLKIVALNELYSTRILYIDLLPLAHHIADCSIDAQIRQGSPIAVDLIWDCPQTRKYYSFATKFCSWHNRHAYPMHDHYVNECLWAYKKQDQFHDFHRDDMYDYAKFVLIVSAFRERYKLTSATFKDLDKFLWRTGKQLLDGL